MSDFTEEMIQRAFSALKDFAEDEALNPPHQFFSEPQRPSTALENSLKVSGLQEIFHKDPARFVEICIARIKAKASILSCFADITRISALNIAASLCYFNSWRDLHEYSKLLPSMNAKSVIADARTFKLSIGAWAITEATGFTETIETHFKLSALILGGEKGASDQRIEYIARKTFSDSSIQSKAFGQLEIFSMIESINSNVDQFMITDLISTYPLTNQQKPLDLDQIEIMDLLEVFAFAKTDDYMSYKKYSELLCRRIKHHIRYYIENTTRDIAGLFYEDSLSDKNSLLIKFGHPSIDNEINDFIKSRFHKLGHPALSFLVKQPNQDRMYGEENNARLDYHRTESTKICLDRKPLESGVFLSVFRKYRKCEEPRQDKLYEVFAVAEDSGGLVIGYISIDYTNSQYRSLGAHAEMLNDHDNTESLEMLHSIGLRCQDGQSYWDYQSAAFVFDWEVAISHQNKGIGTELFHEAFRQGLKGLKKPEVVIANVEPLRYPVTPTCAFTKLPFLNYNKDKDVIESIWNKVTTRSSNFGGIWCDFVAGGHCRHYHGIGDSFYRGINEIRAMDLD
jgi:hypothetical protein